MEKKFNKQYESPRVEVVEMEVEAGLATSSIEGYGSDTNGNHDFGGRGANVRRGTWSDLEE